jgi:uncharacterized membrane protein
MNTDPFVLLMRVLHVLLGVFWGGTVLLNAFFLQPALRDAGPEGGKVMGALLRRGFMTAVPTAAVITLLSGLWLYWQVSGHFDPAYVHSAPGVTFGIGGLAAIVGFTIGMVAIRPNMAKAAALMQAASQASEADRSARPRAGAGPSSASRVRW